MNQAPDHAGLPDEQLSELDQPLDSLCTRVPDKRNAFMLFHEDWEHFKLSGQANDLQLHADRMNDRLLDFCNARLAGGLAGKSVLELGPYEGFHSYRLQQLGAAKVVSIEANPRNFLKCLIVKNCYQLNSVMFLLGDLAKFLETSTSRFDFVLASGILYHLSEPFAVLDRVMERTSAIGVCTTYFDEQHQAFQFTGRTRACSYPGTEPFLLHERENPSGTKGKKHGIDRSAWMFAKPDLLRFIEFRGFQIDLLECGVTPKGGPRVRLFASRPPTNA